MTDLPPGWEWTTLGEILQRIEVGRSFGASRHAASSGKWGIVRVSAMTYGKFRPEENKEIDATIGPDPENQINQGDILVSRANTSAYVGAAVEVTDQPSRLLLSDKSLRLVPTDAVTRRYLMYYLMCPSYRSYVSATATGTKDSMRNISQENLRAAQVPLPPLAEQHRIVAAIDRHLDGVEDGDQFVRACRVRSSSLRDAAIRDALSPPGIAEAAPSPAVSFAVDRDLPPIPVSWTWRRLDEIAEVVGGVTKDTSKQSDPNVPLVPYLRVANVQRGSLDLSEVAQIRATPRQAEKLRLQRGDVLLNEGGDRDKLGRGWVWEGQIENCIHQNHVFRARLRDDVLHPKLLAWHANSFGRWFERNGKQSVNLASISLTTIKQLPVPVPPRDVQDAMVAKIEDTLASCDRLDAVMGGASARAGMLRAAVLDEAFRGGLTQQDLADEPASALLERIRAERAAAPPTSPARRRAPHRSAPYSFARRPPSKPLDR